MADTIHCTYTGNMRVEMHKEGTHDILHTAHDNTGTYVTPGDMLLSALGACTLTMMSVVAMKAKQNMDGTKIDVSGEFAPNAGGLVAVHFKVSFPDPVGPGMCKHHFGGGEPRPRRKRFKHDNKFLGENQ